MMLESPMPFICGVKISEHKFLTQVYSKMKITQKNRMLMCLLDSNSVTPYEFDSQDLFLPHFKGAFGKFLTDFSSFHSIKMSKYFTLEKTKLPNKQEMLSFKMKQKPDKKHQKNKAKAIITPQNQLGRSKLT